MDTIQPNIPEVWNAFPWLPHYRQPVWDGIAAGQGNDYRFKVLGVSHPGEVIDVKNMNYLRLLPRFGAWPWKIGATDLGRMVREEKPPVVIMVANPRYKEGWEIPKIVRSYGGISVLWTKTHGYSHPLFGMRDWIKRQLFTAYDFAIVYSQMAGDEMNAFGMPRERIFVAQNTIDTRRIFRDAQLYADAAVELRKRHGLADKKILLDLGRMAPDKRHEDALRAWPRLRDLDKDLVLVLVGGGASLESLRAMAKQIDPQRIHVMGRVPEGEDYAWIAASDITLQCGAVGLAINQSMAFGKPTVIADQLGPDTELLVDGQTGWRYAEGDLDAMVGAIAKVLNNPQERSRITDRARCLIRDEANIDNMVRQVDACIRAALVLYREKAGK